MPQSVDHNGPSQTSPDIFAYDMVVAANFKPWTQRGLLNQWVVNATIEGLCAWDVGARSVTVSAGHIILMRPHSAHIWAPFPFPLVSTSRSRPAMQYRGWHAAYAAFNPRPHWLPWLESHSFNDGISVIHLEGGPWTVFVASILETVAEYRRGGLIRDELTMARLELTLLRLYEYSTHVRGVRDMRVNDAVKYIHQNYSSPLTVPRIAKDIGLSVSHLTSLFQASIGFAPAQYLERVRLDRAAEMMRFGNASLAVVAAATGYGDPSYFARRFRIRFGMTPREYRASHGRQFV